MQRPTIRRPPRLFALNPFINAPNMLIRPDFLRIGVRRDQGAVGAADRAPGDVWGSVGGAVVGDEGEAVCVAEVEGVGDDLVEDWIGV